MPSERNIFVWDCRGEERQSDPMAVQRRMADYAAEHKISVKACVADCQLADADLPAATDKDREADQLAAFQSYAKLAAMTRAGFGLKSFEDDEASGFTEDECLDLLTSFWKWGESKKKSMAGSSKSAPITVCPQI